MVLYPITAPRDEDVVLLLLSSSEQESSKYFGKKGRHRYIELVFPLARQCLGTLVGDTSESPIKFCSLTGCYKGVLVGTAV